MRPNERRELLLESLLQRREDTIENLASEFGVNERTIGGMLHSVLPFFTHRATNSPRTACDEFAAALLFVQPQTVDACEKFQRPHGSA